MADGNDDGHDQNEIARLRDDLEDMRQSLIQCQEASASPNKSEAVGELDYDDFRDKTMECADEIGYTGEITFYCEEFPCIAKFEGEVEPADLKQALQRVYGEDVDVMIEKHTSVVGPGPDGVKKLRFAAVVPSKVMNDALRDRFEERTWQVLIQKHLKHKRGTDED